MREFDEHMARESSGNNEITLARPTLAIPRIGSGLGGGSWPIIEEIINGVTPDIDVVVYDYE